MGESSLSKGKADAPWVEKFRPKTLEDVAAHKEIIDTSAQSLRDPSALGPDLSPLLCLLALPCLPFLFKLCHWTHRSQATGEREQAPASLTIWSTRYGQNVHNSSCSTADVWQFPQQHDPGAQRFGRSRHRRCTSTGCRFCQHAHNLQVRVPLKIRLPATNKDNDCEVLG